MSRCGTCVPVDSYPHYPHKAWLKQHPDLPCSGLFKQRASDFVVREELGFELHGSGEHLCLWIEKIGQNTATVAEALAKFAGIKLRDVSYAGKKDKDAYGYQWFSLYLPHRPELPWTQFNLPGVTINKQVWHNKKLRLGCAKGNHFTVRLRSCQHIDLMVARLALIRQQGVPNYYGQQRFGQARYKDSSHQWQWALDGNLQMAQHLLAGETIRHRGKRQMAISALRSWCFNTALSLRAQHVGWHHPLAGDALMLAGSNSYFCADVIDATVTERLQERDLYLSVPLLGKGKLGSAASANNFEMQFCQHYQALHDVLQRLGLSMERRAMQLFPENIHSKINGDDVVIQFSLPRGCFATSVLRELGDIQQHANPTE